MDCPDCDRLNDEEAAAAIELVNSDLPISPSATIAEIEAQKRRKMAAKARWNTARERLSAHRASHQESETLVP
jgi:hypothetical protein